MGAMALTVSTEEGPLRFAGMAGVVMGSARNMIAEINPN